MEQQLPDKGLCPIIEEIDPQRIRAKIKELTTVGTRHTPSSQTEFAESKPRVTVSMYTRQPVARMPNATVISHWS